MNWVFAATAASKSAPSRRPEYFGIPWLSGLPPLLYCYGHVR
jgi:hypothetical protein